MSHLAKHENRMALKLPVYVCVAQLLAEPAAKLGNPRQPVTSLTIRQSAARTKKKKSQPRLYPRALPSTGWPGRSVTRLCWELVIAATVDERRTSRNWLSRWPASMRTGTPSTACWHKPHARFLGQSPRPALPANVDPNKAIQVRLF